MIQTRSITRTFQGALMALSIVASFFAFQDFATPADERAEHVKTEWLASRKISKRTVAYHETAHRSARPVSPVDDRVAELNYSRRIKTRIASATPPPAVPQKVVPEKTVAGLPDEDPFVTPG